MALENITINGRAVDLSSRVQQTTTVSASPSGASETVVASTAAFDKSIPIVTGVLLIAEIAYTLGTSAASAQVRIRQGTSAGSGTVVYNSGAQTGGHSTAGQLVADSGGGFDTAPAAGQQYCITLTVASGAAASTVSFVSLTAIAI